MGRVYFLVRGDKTTCGGKIIGGADDNTIMGKPQARELDKVTCGKHSGIYQIVGGVAQTDIHGRLMAGSLDSQSSCPCKARFIASMMNDTYAKEGSASTSDTSVTASQETDNKLNDENDAKHELYCTHADGAIQVANYILEEIKKNAIGDVAQQIRYCIDDEAIKQRRKEWDNLPFYAKSSLPPPQHDLLTAMAIWYQVVKTGSTWDHKPKIRDRFSTVAVARPLPRKGKPSRSYYHKFKRHDYFYDVWSNIHYGYVGLSVGFSETLLLKGSAWEQNMTPGAVGDDTLDDVTSMKIGFKLFHQHGKYAESLTFNNILDALENTPVQSLPHSREKHWCWNTDNSEKIEE